MTRRSVVLAALAAAVATLAPVARGGAAPATSTPAPAAAKAALPDAVRRPILGVWRGRSDCVVKGGACRDELVQYEITWAPGRPDSVRLAADRLDGAEWRRAYAVSFGWNAKTRRWDCVYASPRARILWSYEVRGDSLLGGLVDLASRKLLRTVRAARYKPAVTAR